MKLVTYSIKVCTIIRKLMRVRSQKYIGPDYVINDGQVLK